LPKEIEGLIQLEMKLTSDSLQEWTKGLRWQKVIVYVPKFTMTSQFSLEDTLKAMGMTLAFGQKADFSRMSAGEGLYISAVVHKAFVDVNEKGTEAAAATMVEEPKKEELMREEPKVEPPVFRADHPFLFLIRENETDSILFMGRVRNPEQ
jgi:serpin B